MNTVDERQEKNKEELLEQLKKRPIVQVACERVGIGRATYYRWRKEDVRFARGADRALREGILLVNDMAESQLMSAIRDKNMTAIIFWLKNHHLQYVDKTEVSAKVKTDSSILTPEDIAKADAIIAAAHRPIEIPKRDALTDPVTVSEEGKNEIVPIPE
jgi:ACT domain-containing protein